MKKFFVALVATLSFGGEAGTDTAAWVAANAHSSIPHPVASRFVASAKKYGAVHRIDPVLILAVMRVESGFRTKAVSSEGAMGVMQVIPKYHREKIGRRDIRNLDTGIDVGTQVLAEYLAWARGDVRKALRRYSGGSRGYPSLVLATRARIVMESEEAARMVQTASTSLEK